MSKQTKTTLVIFGILLACWIPYMVMCFPGNIAYDSGTGISWFLNLDRSNPNNPYFQNVLMGLFYSLGTLVNNPIVGVAVYCILQALLTAFLLAKTLAWVRTKIRRKKAAWVPVALYALVPAFPLYAFTMAKDSNFALAILFFEYLAMQAVLEPEAFRKSKSKGWLLALSILLMALLRNHAGYLPALAFGIYALAKREKGLLVKAGSAILAVVFVSLPLPKILGIPETETKESLAMPLQTTAYYLQEHPDELSDMEYEAVNTVLPFETWLSKYNKDTADPIKTPARLNPVTTGPFLQAWRSLWAKRPGTMLEGWFRSTDGYLLPWVQTKAKAHAVIGDRMEKKTIRALGLNKWRNPMEKTARAADDAFMSVPGISWLGNIGLYSWLLIALAVVVLIRKKGAFFLCLAPLLMVFLGCLLSPVNGYYRYAFPFILSLPPVFLLVLASPEARREPRGRIEGKHVRKDALPPKAADLSRIKDMKKSTIIKGLALILLCAFLLDAGLFYTSPESFAEKQSLTLDTGNILISGCNNEDGLYVPRKSAGQLNFTSDVAQAENIEIRFTEPLREDTTMRFFYAEGGIKQITRDQSMENTFPRGSQSVSFRFPQGDWTDYQLVFYGKVALRDVTVSQRTYRTVYAPNIPRLAAAFAVFALLALLYLVVKPLQSAAKAVNTHLVCPETRSKVVDFAYMAFAMVMLLHIIYTSIQYFSVQIGTARFHTAMLVFAVVSALLGRLWKDRGAWILLALLAINFLRVFLFNYDAMDTVEPFLTMAVYAFFGVYATARVLKPEHRKPFLLAFCALWTAVVTTVSVLGIYAARTGEALGGFRTLQLLNGRLYIIRHPVASGIFESSGLAVALLGFSLCKKRVGKILFALPVPVILLAGILTSTRTNYLLTAIALGSVACLFLYDRLKPVKRRKGYGLPAWKWLVLVLAFVVIVAGIAVLEPYAIDGFNAMSGNKGLLLNSALAEGAKSAVPKIKNRNFSNYGAISLTGRLDIWESLFKAIGKDPSILLYGHSLDYNMGAVNEFLRPVLGFDAYHCHNTVLQMLLENGLPAALLYVCFHLIFLVHAFRLMSDRDLPFWKRMVPLPGLVCMIGGFIDITAHFRCGNPQMVLLYLFIGFTVALSRQEKKQRKEQESQ